MQGVSRPDRELLDVAALCGHLLAPGSVHVFLAEHRGRLFPDEMFEDLFPSGRGRPSVPADVIATVMVLQSLEGLSDRQAVRRLETDITWKAAAGLALGDEAFHHTVLVLWRNKLRGSARPERIFDAVRQVMAASKVIENKTRRALDSTVLDDAVARQDTIDLLVTQIRRVRKLIPQLAWVPVREHNLDGPGRPPCDWDDPADIDRLISELVDDANELVWAGEDLVDAGVELSETQADALALLALVAGQDVEPGERPGTWKIATRTAADRVISTVDPESRHAHKTAHSYRDGFKVHVAVEPETGLVTDCDLGSGNASDASAAPGLIAGDTDAETVLGDSAYGSGELRAHLEGEGKHAVIKPPPISTAVAGGFSIDDFDIDTAGRTVTCPAGVTVTLNKHDQARFGAHCNNCPLRSVCTKARKGRVIRVHPHHRLLAAARRQAATDAFGDEYRQWRPMVERTIAWLTRGSCRKLRYRGIERNRLWWHHRCAAVNLQRLVTLGVAATPQGGWVMA
jgi:IS5 family transposase